jgi:hypothetical protein
MIKSGERKTINILDTNTILVGGVCSGTYYVFCMKNNKPLKCMAGEGWGSTLNFKKPLDIC